MVAQACQGLGEAAPLNSEEHGLQSLPLVVNTVRCVALQGTSEVLMAEVLCAPLFSVLCFACGQGGVPGPVWDPPTRSCVCTV